MAGPASAGHLGPAFPGVKDGAGCRTAGHAMACSESHKSLVSAIAGAKSLRMSFQHFDLAWSSRKALVAFLDHVLGSLGMIFSENRPPLFRIMHWISWA
jgi:hypothetical protein